MSQIVLASGNSGKLSEFKHLLSRCGYDVVAQSDYGVPIVEETGLSFVENAILKARSATFHTGLPALADDSGLDVDALGGEPGIYSARFAGPNADDESNNAKLLQLMEGVPEEKRTARYHCVLVYMRYDRDPMPLICQGTWEGSILMEPQGDGGFGYDPIFWVPDEGCSAAELTHREKNQISHRGQALRQLLEAMYVQS